MRILGLDLGTHTGWACSCEPTNVNPRVVCTLADRWGVHSSSGVYDVPKHEHIGLRFNAFRCWLGGIMRDHDLVAYDAVEEDDR